MQLGRFRFLYKILTCGSVLERGSLHSADKKGTEKREGERKRGESVHCILILSRHRFGQSTLVILEILLERAGSGNLEREYFRFIGSSAHHQQTL